MLSELDNYLSIFNVIFTFTTGVSVLTTMYSSIFAYFYVTQRFSSEYDLSIGPLFYIYLLTVYGLVTNVCLNIVVSMTHWLMGMIRGADNVGLELFVTLIIDFGSFGAQIALVVSTSIVFWLNEFILLPLEHQAYYIILACIGATIIGVTLGVGLGLTIALVIYYEPYSMMETLSDGESDEQLGDIEVSIEEKCDSPRYWVNWNEEKYCISDGTEEFQDVLNQKPYWPDYGSHSYTTTLQDFYKSDLIGQKIDGVFKLGTKQLQTPLKDMMYESDNYGYYVIYKIQQSDDGLGVYKDVFLLSNEKKDLPILTQYDSNQDHICCYQQTNAKNTELKQYINGFARIITYKVVAFTDTGLGLEKEASDDGADLKYASEIYEGQVEEGEPTGFGRKLFVKDELNFYGFVGFFSAETITAYGYGIYFGKKDGYSFVGIGVFKVGQPIDNMSVMSVPGYKGAYTSWSGIPLFSNNPEDFKE